MKGFLYVRLYFKSCFDFMSDGSGEPGDCMSSKNGEVPELYYPEGYMSCVRVRGSSLLEWVEGEQLIASGGGGIICELSSY